MPFIFSVNEKMTMYSAIMSLGVSASELSK
jgi:hypothetical protein